MKGWSMRISIRPGISGGMCGELSIARSSKRRTMEARAPGTGGVEEGSGMARQGRAVLSLRAMVSALARLCSALAGLGKHGAGSG
jgi:hypothetical protein